MLAVPEELFFPDVRTGRSGRLRTGLYTGRLPIRITVGDTSFDEVDIEVRSKKLGYLEDYRWMLRDLTEDFTEILLDAFAPTEQTFAPVPEREAETLYHRFCWLKSLLETETFEASIQRIVSSPYVTWSDISEVRPVRYGVRPTPSFYRQLASRFPRFELPHAIGRIDTVPIDVEVTQSEETADNVPNRFVKTALLRWRSEVAYIKHVLGTSPSTSTTRRGLQETEEVLEHLDHLLGQTVFKSVGELREQVGANQVLLRKEGYKEVLHAYLQSELASRLAWDGSEDVFSGGQRDVASLYEFWVYLQLASGLSDLLDQPFKLRDLFALTPGGFRLHLKQRNAAVLQGETQRFGRRIRVRFWYNRSFGRAGSWTQTMRPDYTIELKSIGGSQIRLKPVLLHFDAKYRIEDLTQVFGDAGKGPEKKRRAKRTDLLKMHAYKDAIRHSAGAYVVYPGELDQPLFEHHEILPGLGAFALRPLANGGSTTKQIMGFINDVLDHFALQVTQHERYRFWKEQTYSKQTSGPKVPAAEFIPKPPRDTLLLLGYVKSQAHLDWIERNGLYNLRADDRTGSVGVSGKEASVSIVALYGEGMPFLRLYTIDAAPVVWDRDQMQTAGYPQPRGKSYLCLKIRRITDGRWDSTVTVKQIEKIAPSIKGAPVVLTWAEFAVMRAMSE